MIVCEREFEQPDPHYPQFSMCEVDVLSGKDYRLTIRKDIKNGKYQAYRSWFSEEAKHRHANALAFQPHSFTIEGDPGFYDIEVVKEGTLAEVLDYTNAAWREQFSTIPLKVDTVCPHEGSWRERAVGCR